MANRKISQLNPADQLLDNERLLITQSGTNKTATVPVLGAKLNSDISAAVSAAASQSAGFASGARASVTAAGSVMSQDLSTAVSTLHRSPNAVTAMFVYDTSKDSDGGAWTEKCQGTSWYNESINGKWLGAVVGASLAACETAARAISGAVAGSYYQASFDGEFYSLNSGSGYTKVFRGNKREFPKIAALVTESTSNTLTIYDLTEKNNPMWRRFSSGSSFTMVNGCLYRGSGAILYKDDYVKDSFNINLFTNSTSWHITGLTYTFSSQYSTVDPTTNLRIPVIGFTGQYGSGGNAGIYYPDGVLALTGSPWAGSVMQSASPRFDSYGRLIWTLAPYHIGVSPIFPRTTFAGSNSTGYFNGATYTGSIIPLTYGIGTIKTVGKNNAFVSSNFNVGLNIIRQGYSSLTDKIFSAISNDTNTGYFLYNTKRVYLSDINGTSLSTSEEKMNDPYFLSGTTGWVPGGSGAITWANNSLELRNSTAGIVYCSAVYTLNNLVSGKTYYVDFNIKTASVGYGTSVTIDTKTVLNSGGVSGIHTQYNGTFVAASSTATITVAGIFQGGSSNVFAIDKFSVKTSMVLDKSPTRTHASIFGNILRSPVATNSQLVAYSGFSNLNYLREPYSADLDFGTGEWSASVWVNIPNTNATAGTILSRYYSSVAPYTTTTTPYITLGIDATNKLTATAFDGTTTRTITSTNAYNTGTWIKPEVTYTTNGTLSLKVNGIDAATPVTGSPLLTLNNLNAVLTIGNNYATTAPFPGSIALLKLSGTVPTPEQSLWMYEQEKQMFQPGAQVCLPASGAITDLAYDDATDSWIAAQGTHVSEWNGLVRTSYEKPSAGSFNKVTAASGIRLISRTTTNPGVDIETRPVQVKREFYQSTDSAINNQNTTVFDFDSVTGQTDFVLPVGYTAQAVFSGGVQMFEGTTGNRFTRLFDGFKETIRFLTAPGNAVWVKIRAVRSQ